MDFLHQYDRARYPVGWLMSGVTEAAIQKQVVARLRMLGVEPAVVDAGAARLRGRAAALLAARGVAKAAVHLKGLAGGMERGISDVVGTRRSDGRAVYLEVKKPEWLEVSLKTGRAIQKRAAGEATDEQLRFLRRMRAAGAIVGVVWSPVDVDFVLASAGGPA